MDMCWRGAPLSEISAHWNYNKKGKAICMILTNSGSSSFLLEYGRQLIFLWIQWQHQGILQINRQTEKRVVSLAYIVLMSESGMQPSSLISITRKDRVFRRIGDICKQLVFKRRFTWTFALENFWNWYQNVQ